MKNFDVFVGVDWSGAKSPMRTKSIALAGLHQTSSQIELYDQIRSRTAVFEWILAQINSSYRILVGVDCNFGYAQEVGVQQFGVSYDHRDLWAEVEACNEGKENFFAGGFWQHPKYAKYFWETGKKPVGFSMPRRLTEVICGEAGMGWPESPFKLIGAKQVGKGGLSGMRLAYHLKKQLGEKVCIWPFEQHLCMSAQIVITEIYPRQFIRRAGLGSKKLDLKSLNTALEFFKSAPIKDKNITDHDADAIVSAAGLRYLCGGKETVPQRLAYPKMLDTKRASREGWIFGVGF